MCVRAPTQVDALSTFNFRTCFRILAYNMSDVIDPLNGACERVSVRTYGCASPIG